MLGNRVVESITKAGAAAQLEAAGLLAVRYGSVLIPLDRSHEVHGIRGRSEPTAHRVESVPPMAIPRLRPADGSNLLGATEIAVGA